LVKPVAFAELVARLNAMLRRAVHHDEHGSADQLTMDPVSHGVRWRDSRVELSPTEYRLLARLIAQPDAVVRRQQLREAAWPAGGIVSDNTLDQYLSKLRRKLAELGAPHVLKVARGVGYQVVRPE
jgi:two-component system response regulator MprA